MPPTQRTREIPREVRELLAGSLTERGMRQWWNARLRYLDGHTPAERWRDHREAVMQAAHAFGDGVYL